MKKTIVLLLALLYVTITSGVIVNIHYCMGEIASVNYGHEEDHPCDKCGMEEEEKDGCCHTEHHLIKTDDEHLFTKGLQDLTSWVAAPPVATIAPVTTPLPVANNIRAPYDFPPPRRNTSLCIYHAVFRI